MTICHLCLRIDIRALLLESATQAPESTGLTGRLYSDTNDYRPPIPFFHRHHDTIIGLKNSAERGCQLCDLFWSTWIKTINKAEITEEWVDKAFKGELYLGVSGWIEARQGAPYITLSQKISNGTARTLCSFEPFANRDSPPSDDLSLLGRSIYPDAASKKCLSVAAAWLDTCLKEHGTCGGGSRHQNPMPTRVIDVGDENTPPKLFTTHGKIDIWIALSYCWGGDSIFIHNDNTISSLEVGIPLNDYPPTLRDAIIITRALSIKYIWIDALCIKQDSPQDWAAEAAKMGEVYSGAILTISAANAPSTRSGIFSKRTAGFSEIGLEWKEPTTSETSAKVYLRSGSELWDHSLQNSALQTRGWTLQEGLLSPRTLSYGAQQMMWECQQYQVDEGGRATQPTQEYRSKKFIQQLLQAGKHPISKPPSLLERLHLRSSKQQEWWRTLSIQDPYDKWYKITEQFTTRSLTKDFDVLPALSGLARAFQPVLNDVYLAGHWKKELMATLTWSRNVMHPSDHSARFDLKKPSGYLAPSWSWASILGNVYAMSNTWKARDALASSTLKTAEIIDVYTIPKGNDPFGQVIGGELVLRGRFFPIQTLPPVWTVSNPFPDEPSDLPALLALERLTYNYMRLVDNVIYEYYQKHIPYQGQNFGLIEIIRWNAAPGSGIPGMDFLLLESTEEGKWRRVGEVTVRKNQLPNREDVGEDAYRFLVLENQAFAEVETTGKKKRTVTIV